MRVVVDRSSAELGDIVIPGWAAHPDRIPAFPNAWDDEFDAPLSSIWTPVNSAALLAYDSNKTTLSCLTIAGVVANTSDLEGLFKACPTIPFTLTAKIADGLSNLNAANNFGAVCLGVGEASMTGKFMTISSLSNQAGQSYNIEVQQWTNPTTYINSPFFNPATQGYGRYSPTYLRLAVTATNNVAGYWSFDGILYTPRFTGYDPGFTIGAAGLAINRSVNNVATIGTFDWIRVKAGVANPMIA